jgi:hypothetical protein
MAQESFSLWRSSDDCPELGISFAATKSVEFHKIGLFRLSLSQANSEVCTSSKGPASVSGGFRLQAVGRQSQSPVR